MNFTNVVGSRKRCSLFNVISSYGSFHIRGDSMTFFIERRTQYFFLPESQSVFYSMDLSFQFGFVVANHVLPICKHFLTKACYSVHIKYPSINSTWLAFLKHQKCDVRHLFKPGALCLIFGHFELRANKYFLQAENNFC